MICLTFVAPLALCYQKGPDAWVRNFVAGMGMQEAVRARVGDNPEIKAFFGGRGDPLKKRILPPSRSPAPPTISLLTVKRAFNRV